MKRSIKKCPASAGLSSSYGTSAAAEVCRAQASPAMITYDIIALTDRLQVGLVFSQVWTRLLMRMRMMMETYRMPEIKRTNFATHCWKKMVLNSQLGLSWGPWTHHCTQSWLCLLYANTDTHSHTCALPCAGTINRLVLKDREPWLWRESLSNAFSVEPVNMILAVGSYWQLGERGQVFPPRIHGFPFPASNSFISMMSKDSVDGKNNDTGF